MSTLRRISSDVNLRRVNDTCTGSDCRFSEMLKEWSHHSVRADAERRAGVLAKEREAREVFRETLVQASKQSMEDRIVASRAAEFKRNLAREVEDLRTQRAICQEADWLVANEASQEVRNLRRHCLDLQASQMQSIQLLERELRDEEGRQDESAALGGVELMRLHDINTEIARQGARRTASQQLRNDLRAQIEQTMETRSKCLNVERQQDRAMADQSAARMRNDDLQALEHRRRLQLEVGQALDAIISEQRHTKRDIQGVHHAWQAHDVVSSDIMPQSRRHSETLQRWASERRNAGKARDLVLHQLSHDLQLHNLQTRELDELRTLMQTEAAHAKERDKEEERLQHRLTSQAAELDACRESMRRLEDRRHAAQEEEARLRIDFLAKIADEDRLSQLGDQKRRSLLLEHRRAADQYVREKRISREAELQRMHEDLARTNKEDERRMHIIEDEYQLLLREHGLVDVRCWLLPKGMRQNKDSAVAVH